MQRDVHERTTALDKERFEVACLRQDIIDEYEKKSGELLDYLNSMESAFERQGREFDVREAALLKLNEDLKHELSCGSRLKYKAEKVLMSKTHHQLLHECKTSWEVERALDILKEESSEYENKYRSEQRRVQVSTKRLAEFSVSTEFPLRPSHCTPSYGIVIAFNHLL